MIARNFKTNKFPVENANNFHLEFLEAELDLIEFLNDFYAK
jgi:hypothetical protein